MAVAKDYNSKDSRIKATLTLNIESINKKRKKKKLGSHILKSIDFFFPNHKLNKVRN